MSSQYKMNGLDSDSSFGSSNGAKRGGGLYISATQGFILVLLTVAISVGVGVIVFFAGGREVVCRCEGNSDGSPSLTPEALRQMCIDVISEGGGDEICEVCSAVPESTNPTTPGTDGTTSPTTQAPTEPPRDYRLPITVRPYLYDIVLQPNIYGGENGTFDFVGSVKIHTVAEKADTTIVLHAHPRLNVTLSTIKVTNIDTGSQVEVDSTSYEELREFLTLHLKSSLVIGQHYSLEMEFHGPLLQSGSGLYLAYYEENGEKIYLATTQFEAPHARKAFPCFDEPHLKAEFDITLIRQETGTRNYRSLSNAPLKTTETSTVPNMVRDVYERTVVMPTYLLAFIVCDYQHWDNHTSNTTYRTWAMPERVAYAQKAQEHGLKIFDLFQHYFKPPYVFSKLDNIAIPDFSAGAMENWGLITYRDTLLYEPGVSSASTENWIAEVISHEIAHQWFGNLVSPKWWNWLWLNEAFASFWDYHIVGEIYPSWRKLDMHTGSMHGALDADSQRTSHPLTADVMTPQEISSIFDTITYTKGSAVVRMMHLAMGQDLFIQGLNRYLDNKQYDVAEHQDLWDALTNEAEANSVPLNMTEIMDPWVTQMNFPVVNVAIDRTLGEVTITQNRFLITDGDDPDEKPGAYGYKWTIPVTYTTSASPNFTTEYVYSSVKHMKYHQATYTITVPAMPADGWIMVNLQQCGFFRVNYDTQNWDNIINYLGTDDFVKVHPINRAQVINDAWNLAKAGLLPQEVALRTVSNLGRDLDYAPWRAFIRELSYVENMLQRTMVFGIFEEFIQKIVKTPFEVLGTNMTEDMPPVDKIEKGQIVSLACGYDFAPCVAAALDSFNLWVNNNTNNIYPDLRSPFYCTAVRHGGLSEWEFVYDHYHAAVDTTEKNRLRQALACTREPALLRRLLEMSLQPEEIRPQDTRTTITYVANNKWGRELAWDFFTHNFDSMNQVNSISGVSRLLRDITAKYNTAGELQKVEDFMQHNDITGAESGFQQVVERTKTNMKWLEDNLLVFQDWLEAELQP